MTANLNGVRFDQIYGDNSGTNGGQHPFDTDGDGTATQEDEFVSFTNDSGTPMDVSGWQIWSDSAGSGAPDKPQDGLFHTFPPGTILQPGETLYIINEVTGEPPSWAQEASEGGIESGAGGQNTNFLTEGMSGRAAESVALVDPASGEYIVFNMSSAPAQIENVAGFPSTHKVDTVEAHSVMEDQAAGTSYRYNSSTGAYEPRQVSVPCFAAGTLIATACGDLPVERLRIGDLVQTRDAGLQPVRWIGSRRLSETLLNATQQHPIEFKPSSLGAGVPRASLRVSPQHRMLIAGDILAPARGLLDLPGVRVAKGCRAVTYHHIFFYFHAVLMANGAPSESLLPGPTFLASCPVSERLDVMRIAGSRPIPARTCLTVNETRKRVRASRALGAVGAGSDVSA